MSANNDWLDQFEDGNATRGHASEVEIIPHPAVSPSMTSRRFPAPVARRQGGRRGYDIKPPTRVAAMARSSVNHPIKPSANRLIVNVDPLPGDLTMRSFGSKMICTRCGTIGADVRPNWLGARAVGLRGHREGWLLLIRKQPPLGAGGTSELGRFCCKSRLEDGGES
jgi:hypothetical protein